ncbi:hypothetical protein NECID01_1903, partial [Nematocida sp. AWRm77]
LLESVAVSALVESIPTIEQLSFSCNILEDVAIDSFKKCSRLETLELDGVSQPSASFLIKLLEVCLLLQDLTIAIDTANLALADTLRKCINLRSLKLTLARYTPGFLAHYLQDPLPSLTFLKLYIANTSKNYSEEDKIAVEKARLNGMSI